MPVLATLIALLLAPLLPAAGTLDFYTIDVEGGKSVLIVSPAGETMLIDAGWPAAPNRAASVDRIVEAVKAAGLARIDYLLISHFDIDHIGDVPLLASKIPIGHVVDHGDPAAGASERFKAYDATRTRIGHTVVKPGDKIPIKGVDIEVVAAGNQFIRKPLKGAGAPNPLCAATPQAAAIERDVEDNQSVGVLFIFGKFRMLDLADLEAHFSRDLVCPNNLIGTVSAYHVNVHGQFKGIAPELIGAIHPRVAIMGNGARKGADPPSWPLLRATPGLEDIWQVHYSEAGTKETNPPADFVANLEGPDEFKMIKLAARQDGTFTVTNTRSGFSKSYKPGK
ncbi:MAG: MBL fold metallo-hydrolase [Bryobacteraceae bacterium]